MARSSSSETARKQSRVVWKRDAVYVRAFALIRSFSSHAQASLHSSRWASVTYRQLIPRSSSRGLLRYSWAEGPAIISWRIYLPRVPEKFSAVLPGPQSRRAVELKIAFSSRLNREWCHVFNLLSKHLSAM